MAPKQKLVRVRRPDGVVVEVPTSTKAIPIQPIDPSAPATGTVEPLAMDSDGHRAFNTLAKPIEKYIGHLVSYQPVADRAEVFEGVVEGVVS